MRPAMDKAIVIDRAGGPEAMRYVPFEAGAPGPGEARVRHHAIGLNYIDIYYRSGLYAHPLPTGLGVEAAGVVEAVGPGVSAVAPGDRVAYASRQLGAYASARVIQADRLIKLPDDISYEQAAAIMLQGLTAQYLLRQTWRVQPGETILFHAAAGGLGSIATQWAKHLGATVIGTVGSDAKAERARANGCAHTIVYTRENVVERVREITGGEGVPVVYDSVGKDTYWISLDCLRPLGLFVSCGNASGPIPPIDSQDLAKRGSLFFTRPGVFTYTARRDNLERMCAELFEVIRSGAVRIDIAQRFALGDVAEAHRKLESRQTTGATILLPD